MYSKIVDMLIAAIPSGNIRMAARSKDSSWTIENNSYGSVMRSGGGNTGHTMKGIKLTAHQPRIMSANTIRVTILDLPQAWREYGVFSQVELPEEK